MVDAGAPRNAPATHMHGYLSRDGLPPAELLAAGRNEVSSYGGDIVAGTVTELVPDGRSGFWVLLADGQRISTRRLLVTTGLRDELPDIPGLRERWARDVLHCPYCHGHEVRDRRLGVLGGSPGRRPVRPDRPAVDPRPGLLHPARRLTAAERTQLVARAIGVVEGTVEQLVIDDDQLCGVQMGEGCVMPRDALFVPPRFVPNNHLAGRPGLRRRRRRLGHRRHHRTHQRRRSVGCRATSSTRAPRSSPPPAPAPRPPSRSTPTWSTTTCATPSATSTRAPAPPHPNTDRTGSR